jgi:hypothetical protein
MNIFVHTAIESISFFSMNKCFFKGEMLSNKSAGSKSWCYFIKLLYDDDHDNPCQHYKWHKGHKRKDNKILLHFYC